MVKTKTIVYFLTALVVLAFGFIGGTVAQIVLWLSIILNLLLIYITPELAAFTLIVWAFNYYGTVSYINLAGSHLAVSDLCGLIFLVLVIKCIARGYAISVDKIGKIILLFFCIVLGSTISSLFIYGQSPITTLYVARALYAYLIYLPLRILYKNGALSRISVYNQIKKAIKIMALVLLIEYILIVFANLNITNYVIRIRWGVRLFVAPILQIIGCMMIIWELCNSRTRIKNWLWLALYVFEIVCISQSRVAIAGTVVAILIEIIMTRKMHKKWIVLGLIISVIIGIVSIPEVRFVISNSLSEIDSEDSGNYYVRSQEQVYFESLLDGHELFGVGMPASSGEGSAQYAGRIYDYFVSDLGYFGMRYYYGYFGLLFYVLAIVYGMYYCFVRRHIDVYMISFTWFLFNIMVSQTLFYALSRPAIFTVMLILLGLADDRNDGGTNLLIDI